MDTNTTTTTKTTAKRASRAGKSRQITVHFEGEQVDILAHFTKMAKCNFRSVEQEILYVLSRAFFYDKSIESEADDFKRIPANPAPSAAELLVTPQPVELN